MILPINTTIFIGNINFINEIQLDIIKHIKIDDREAVANLLYNNSAKILLEAISSMQDKAKQTAMNEANNGNHEKAIKNLHYAKAFDMILSLTKTGDKS